MNLKTLDEPSLNHSIQWEHTEENGWRVRQKLNFKMQKQVLREMIQRVKSGPCGDGS